MHKPITVTDYTKGLKDRNLMTLSISSQKVFDKVQHSLMIIALNS